MKLVWALAIAVVVYVALGLAADAAIGWFQPQGSNTVVLRTFDAGGAPRDTVLALLDDGGQLWVESGHWFRGWYRRVLANPDVELVRGGVAAPYRATALDTPEAVATVERLMGRGTSSSYWVARALLLCAPVRPVRLEPRAAASR